MRRGSTPTHVYTVDIDLSAASVYITYMQGGVTIVEKHDADIAVTATTLTVKLTQAETLKFQEGVIEIQVRYVFPTGDADASDIIKTTAERILKEGVIE